MLTISNIAKAYAGRTLFEDLTLQVNAGDRLGLVGPNGAGKSTLFKIILREEEADDGQISFQRGFTVGFLPQESAPVGEETVLEVATGQMHHEDGRGGMGDSSDTPKAKRILKGLAFRESDFDRPARELSGGWVMRAHLARLLVQEPDLLMLDEPTNHLDLETLLWFQEYLQEYSGGIMLISHDREFLNQLVTGIVEIRNQRLWNYTGNYDNFLAQRAALQQQQSAESIGQRAITLLTVEFSYVTHRVYENLDYQAERGDRTVLVGPNGAGKSTLLKLLAGVLQPQAGERDLGLRTKVGYFAQYRGEMLKSGRTVLEEAFDTPRLMKETDVRSLLGCFLFRGDDVFKKVDVLSGGEKSRLALVKILLDPPNLLLMDEPTTHLDMSSIDALVGALKSYTGTLVFISHDVYFIRALATRVVHVHAGRLIAYSGGYDYFLEKTKSSSARAALTAALTNSSPVQLPKVVKPAPAPVAPVVNGNTKERRQEAAEARRQIADLRRRVGTLEREIATLEARQVNLTTEMEKPETYAKGGAVMQLNRELMAVQDELSTKTAEWESAASKISVLEETANGVPA
jgi:ATP-binding cassette subfamily F protein 3